MKIKKIILKKIISDLIFENFPGDDYEYMTKGGFAKIYRSKSDPTKVRVIATDDASRSLLSSISNINNHIPNFEKLDQYSDLSKNIEAYQTSFYPKLKESSLGFHDFINLVNAYVQSGLNRDGIKYSASKDKKLSDFTDQNNVSRGVTQAVKLIEDVVINSDLDFWWDLDYKNFAMNENDDLILLDVLSPASYEVSEEDVKDINFEELPDIIVI
jgi:hypothetical protein